jgi:hypothetical protein
MTLKEESMLSLTVKTKKNPQEVGKRLVSYFGTGGLGLEETSEGDSYRFTGAGGHVIATVKSEDNQTFIDFETREFEEQVKKFAREAL